MDKQAEPENWPTMFLENAALPLLLGMSRTKHHINPLEAP